MLWHAVQTPSSDIITQMVMVIQQKNNNSGTGSGSDNVTLGIDFLRSPTSWVFRDNMMFSKSNK